MKKWDVNITFTIQAPDRTNAFIEAGEFITRQLRNLADLNTVHELSYKEARERIAINEPIKAQDR